MQMEWKKAITRFMLNNLGQMDQEAVELWLNDELDLAPLLEPPLRAQAQYRDQIMRELHQISPAEIFDLFQKEHPELVFPDRNKAVVRIGKELESLKGIVRSL
jgi:hypothetical protein